MPSTLRPRIIPSLVIDRGRLVKTVRFGEPKYVGDPCNSARIFNELGADELMVLDRAAARGKGPVDYELVGDLASECFMPVSFGGGIKSLDTACRVFDQGVEKIVVGSAFHQNPNLVESIANRFGRQAVIVAIDVMCIPRRGYRIMVNGATRSIRRNLPDTCSLAESSGAGEILLTDVNREGTWKGLNLDLLREATSYLSIPMIGCGGARNFDDVQSAFLSGGCSAVAVGSIVLFQKENFGVLVNFPEEKELELLSRRIQYLR